jgi:hypothetical protein
MLTCRFTTSWGGVARCSEKAYRLDFCRFHYECYRRGEIDARGVISEKVDDQERRRAINFHGVRPGSAPAA